MILLNSKEIEILFQHLLGFVPSVEYLYKNKLRFKKIGNGWLMTITFYDFLGDIGYWLFQKDKFSSV